MGNVFLHGKGGGGGAGSGSELTIVGGTTRPAKATQNMIWIDTNADITSYVLSATEPANPVDGMVWIIIGDSGRTKATSPIGGDWITVYPLSAKQYISGAWVDKPAKSYQSGSWADWILYLFNYGKQSFTWKATNRKTSTSSNWTGVAPSVTTNNDGSVTIKVTKPSNAAHEGSYEMSNSYDLNGRTSLTIKYSVSHSGSNDTGLFELALYSTPPAVGGETRIARINLSKTLTETTLEFNGVGECYIAIHTSNNGWESNNASTASLTLKELILK